MKTEEEIINEIIKSNEDLTKILDKKKYAVSRYSGPAQVAIQYEIKKLTDAFSNLRYCVNVIKRKNKEIEALKMENRDLCFENDKLKKTDYGEFLKNKDDIYKTMVNMIIEENNLYRYLMNVNRILEIKIYCLENNVIDDNVKKQIEDLFKEFRQYNENFRKNDSGG